MSQKIEYNDNPNLETYVLRSKEMDLEAGWLGKIFGGQNNAPMNIAGFMLVVLLISGVLFTYAPSASISAKEYWSVIGPIISLILGYMFGKNTKTS